MKDLFDIQGKVFIVTGGAGLLGVQHAVAIARKNGIPILLDINASKLKIATDKLKKKLNVQAFGLQCDITSESEIGKIYQLIIDKFGRIDGLINNAANNLKMQVGDIPPITRLEEFPLDAWRKDFDISVTGAFLCSRIFGSHMAENNGGVIINISSDLGIIAPDQRIYRVDGINQDSQLVKPVSYSVTKHALIGLTKYLSTYWADKGVRANSLCPGGVFSGQSPELVKNIINLIPLGKMADFEEYHGAIQFLCSEASSYMNGATLVMDGGRSVW